MALLLLTVIYIAFIGLGIPDSLFGAAWPAVYPDFALPVSFASIVTVISTVCTIISGLNSAKVLSRFGTPAVTVFSTGLTALGLLGYSLSSSFIWLCLLSIPLGLGAGAIDTGLNNYVALHYNAMHMSFLHCFYGIGVSISPFLLSILLGSTNNWRSGYRAAFFIQAGITALLFISLPLWKKVHHKSSGSSDEKVTVEILRLKDMLRMPSVIACSMMFMTSCAIESICGNWGSTYLVTSKGLQPDSAASVITLYYVGMALGRFISGVAAKKLTSWQIIFIGQALTLAAFIILLLPVGVNISAIGLFLVGIGNAPLFPNLNHLTPQNFGRERSQCVMGVQMSFGYAGFLVISPLFGILAQRLGTQILPLYLIVIYMVMAIATFTMVRLMKKEGRYK